MPGTFLGLETARRGIRVHQHSINITGHNLANASTPGYTRQEGVLKATDPYSNITLESSVTPGQFGTGVAVDNIRRIRDEYLDFQMRRSSTDTAYWQDQILLLRQAEITFAEPLDKGINTKLVDFFKGWMNLENMPQDPGVKASVVVLGDGLAKLMQTTYNQLESIQHNIAQIDGAGTVVTGGMLKDQADRANEALTQIRDLTATIKNVYAVGQQPNDLLDQRDMLLEELSKFGPVEAVHETGPDGKPTGDFSVLNFFGHDVRIAPSGDSLSLEVDAVTGDVRLLVTDTGGAVNVKNLTQDCNADTRGSLLGLESSRQIIIDARNKLNELAIALRDQVNSQNPAPGSPPIIPAVDFFTGDLENSNFGVEADLLDDPSRLDGTVAGAVAAIRDLDITFTGASNQCTLEEYFGVITAGVGAGAKRANDMAATQSAIKTQVGNLMKSVSGVSTDEEITKLLQYNYGFQASSRVVSVIDDMLDVVINRLF
ncbi:MAG: flagellar hook-associated protein FlgK [Firmicutes bacterium]|nr:flagellar hook-associated protein FlgK [Bacillota bacterium]